MEVVPINLQLEFVPSMVSHDCLERTLQQVRCLLGARQIVTSVKPQSIGDALVAFGLSIARGGKFKIKHGSNKIQPIVQSGVYLCMATVKYSADRHVFAVYVDTNGKRYYADSVLKGFVAYAPAALYWVRCWCVVRRVELQ